MQRASAFLIDGTAFCYRAFYAIRALSTSDGRPTNAVYGFAMMLNALRRTQQPDYLAVAFDAGKPTFRHERYEAYKQQRKPMPDPLITQLPLIKELLAAYRVPVFELEGYEGEDLLATITRRIASESVTVVLVTGDKDALQLVGRQVQVYNPHQDHRMFDEEKVRKRCGVPPEAIVDLMALMGDAIDNIPGVPGIGQKTAAELLRRFGSVDNLYAHLEEVPSESLRTTLRTHHQQVELARGLARIEGEAPLRVELRDLAVREPDWQALRRIFRMLEFKRLLAEIESQGPAAPDMAIQVHLVHDRDAFARLSSSLAVKAPAALARLPAAFEGGQEDTRRGPVPGGSLAMAWQEGEAWIVPLDPSHPAWMAPLGEWLASPAHPKIGHDLKAMILWLRKLGYPLEGIAGDTMIAASLLNPAKPEPDLADLAEERLEIRLKPLAAGPLLHTAPEAQPLAEHAVTILRLFSLLQEALKHAQLDRLYHEVELPLVRVLAEMEATGVALDLARLASMRSQMEGKLTALIKDMSQLAGCEFNLNSPKQLAEVLFQRLKLPIVKRTKTGPSTDSEVLQKLASSHPLPQKLIEYRELAKLMSTYLEALPKLVDSRTGRIHTTFHQTGTATGRLSSSEPNLQNIPIKTELGRQIRKAFVPGQNGCVLVAADYSQIELRILAHLSGDEQLIEAFCKDADIHRYTASLIYRVPEPDVTLDMRNAMKAINYGILYGMSAHGLSKELGISHEDAAAFIQAYFERAPKVRAFLEAQIAQAAREGYAQTLLGRRRYIPELASQDPLVRQFGERMAVNAPIQGTAADLIKLAMVKLALALRARRMASRMILQVHDELVWECPTRELKELAALAKTVMEGALALQVPLKVIVKSGPNWLDLNPV